MSWKSPGGDAACIERHRRRASGRLHFVGVRAYYAHHVFPCCRDGVDLLHLYGRLTGVGLFATMPCVAVFVVRVVRGRRYLLWVVTDTSAAGKIGC